MPRPLIVRYGGWAPDLANNAVEVPPQGLIEAPCADVNNVYFSDSAWKTLPSPNPYAYSVGVLLSTTMLTAIDGSLTGVDANVGTFAQATDANGNTLLQLTSDGSQIILSIGGPNLTASYFASLVYSTGASGPLTLNASDAAYSYNAAGSVNTWTWTTASTFAPGVTYALLLEAFAGEAVLNALTYYDEVANQEVLFAATPDQIATLIDGVWNNITLFGLAGSTINVAAPSFSLIGVMGGIVGPNQASSFKAKLSMGQATARGQLYSGALTAGAGSGGEQTGFVKGTYGSMTPVSDINGRSINALFTTNIVSDRRGPLQSLTLSIAGTLSQSYLSSLVLPTQHLTFLSGAASFIASGGISQWKWDNPGIIFASGVKYATVLNF